MFHLTVEDLENARAAIERHGYSAMLPPPPEWTIVVQSWAAVRDSIAGLDLDTYTPYKALTVFAPKNRANVRVLHLLHPQDLLIYTALALIAKNDIESNRVPKKFKRVFSYRSDASREKELYASAGSYEGYRKQLLLKARLTRAKYVSVADIADFYPRINQHRLENILQAVATTQRVRDVARVLVAKLIGNLMGRDSYGIPVGPYASRLLGEAVLIDVDAFLQSKGVDFVRWVDDYNFFCTSEFDAQSTLFDLGEWLFSKHGLTLQSAKTKIVPVDRYRKETLFDPDEKLTDRDSVVNMLRDFKGGYDEPSDDDLEDAEIEEALALLQAADLKGMLEQSLADTTLVDYQAVTYALTKLPRIPGVPTDLRHEVLDLVIDNAQLLYPVVEHIANYVLSFEDLTITKRKGIARKLLKPLRNARRSPPPYYAMWILHIFASGSEWNHAQDLVKLFSESSSEAVKRYAALALATSGTRSEALALKDEYVASSPLVKLAILFASRKLGSDERKHWRLSQGVGGVVEKNV